MKVDSGLYLRKARKQYECYGFRWKGDKRPEKFILADASKNCLETIKPGDLYFECYWETGGFQSGDRYCKECAKIHLGLSEEQIRQFIK